MLKSRGNSRFKRGKRIWKEHNLKCRVVDLGMCRVKRVAEKIVNEKWEKGGR